MLRFRHRLILTLGSGASKKSSLSSSATPPLPAPGVSGGVSPGLGPGRGRSWFFTFIAIFVTPVGQLFHFLDSAATFCASVY